MMTPIKNKLQAIFQAVAMLKTTPNINESFSGSVGAWRLLKNKLQVIYQGVYMKRECKTLVEILYQVQSRFPDKVFLKYKQEGQFQDITFTQFLTLVEQLAASLYDLGLDKGEKVGIISDNMYQWLVTDLAVLSLGAVDVPRGSDTQIDEIVYILNHSDVKYCFVENPKQADKILAHYSKVNQIKAIILLTGEINQVTTKKIDQIKVFQFNELIKQGRILLEKSAPLLKEKRESIDENHLATIIYTSGTTGNPKGVMLQHKNILHNIYSLPYVLPVNEKDRWLSILPVWHVFERTVEYVILSLGCTMAYSKPVAKHLLVDLEEIKPTYMVSVPRIWESIYHSVIHKIKKSSLKSRAFFYLFTFVGLKYSNAWKTLTGMEPVFKKTFFLISFLRKAWALLKLVLLFLPDKLGDVLVYSKIRQKTGGSLVGPISGGGKLPEYVDDFFSSIKINILEGYGLTETSPVVSVRNFNTLVRTTVGRPSPGVQAMIGDEYWNPLPCQQSKGLLYIKGDLVMAGYYKQPDQTNEVLQDGWLNTGDLARLTLNNEICLVGRLKDTIVLTGGENIEPEPIESKLLEDEFIYQVMVVGQDKKNLGALIVPDEEILTNFARQNNISFVDKDELLTDEFIIDHYKKIVKHQISPKNQFRSFERITCFKLLAKPFEVGNELTQSLKMKRNVISKIYHNTIEALYLKR